ncbi:DUF2752 domain-containing protein [Streptomyces chiangmaiensis]|uniref:DUF2752 domain-containing protein n=1 Tax=Streptomyces chiangmaiensis TaxID=766497 RepID=A0ABU7FV34_9ACTN|nr:DUF2752 domain-containing protein [Streptomyces chiangmaiensis]MED7827740.1 DUF2752 domain-containing protein [Streptomyces chiangmaiensis]
MADTPAPVGALDRSRWSPRIQLGWERRNARWWGLGVAGAVVVMAGVAMAVWGMLPVDLHEPTHNAGVMSPTCGLTRSVVAVFRGDVATAWRYNPAGLLVAGFSVAFLMRLVVGSIAGRGPVLRVRPGRLGWITLGLALAMLEIRQQGQAQLLMTTGLR